MSLCSSCAMSIVWAVTKHGKRMPVDAEPVVGGTILLSYLQVGAPPVAEVIEADQLETLAAQHERSPQAGPLRLHVSHFATCPNANQHRRSR